jgi:hypothetical protein
MEYIHIYIYIYKKVEINGEATKVENINEGRRFPSSAIRKYVSFK